MKREAMYASRCLPLGMVFFVPLFACNGAASDSDAGVPLPDARVQPEMTVPDATTPGCAMACPEICFDGTCTESGPMKTCGADTYPTKLPTDNDGVYYVNASAVAGGDGSKAKPFKTISAALDAIPGERKYTVAVAAGDYDENLLIGQRGDPAIAFGADLFCICPEKVAIRQKIAIVPRAPLKVTIDGCSVVPMQYDTCQWASCPNTGDPPRGIEAKGYGYELHVLVRDSVIAGWCTGVYYSADAQLGLDASFCLAHSRISGNHKGVDVQSAPATKNNFSFDECKALDENLGLVLNRLDHNRDYAVFTRDFALGIAMKGNVVEGGGELCGTKSGQGFGVYLGDTDSADLSANLIRYNQNRGIGLRNKNAKVSRGISVTNNVLIGNTGAGIALQKMQATVAIDLIGNQVFATKTLAGEPGGDGIQTSVDQASSYVVNIQDNTVDGSDRHGLFYDGVGGTVDGNSITNNSGYGCVLQQSSATLGTNTWGGNGAGDTHNYMDPVVTHGGMPIPIL